MNKMKQIGLIALGAAMLGGCGGLGGFLGDGGGGGGGDAGSGPEPHFASLYAGYLDKCALCHAPKAPGRTSDTEKTLDFSTKTTAYMTLTAGAATGLQGSVAACNGVKFITPGKPAASLLVAVVDQATRKAFDYPMTPACDDSAMTDMTVKTGSQPPTGFVAALKQWITDGALND